MCGIVGIIACNPVNQDIYDALTVLQHRGQDAAGIMTSDGQRIFLRKSNGLVRDVIRKSHMLRLIGNIGIGHVRYPTAGTESPAESQPFYVNSPYGLGLVHNGNLVNVKELTHNLIRTDLRHLNTASDSEILLNVVAHELQCFGNMRFSPEQLFKAMAKVYNRIEGAFAAVMIINGHGIVGFRDPNAIRPLIYGKRDNGTMSEFILASESIVLDVLGFERLSDVNPGEVVYFDQYGKIHRKQCAKKISLSPCIFEYIYLSRPDSIMDNISIYQARVGMGKSLAEKILRDKPTHDIDVVIPIPDTSRNAAHALAQVLQIPYLEGFVKNRYIGRTFIMPGQALRQNSVRLKLNAIKTEFTNKTVLLVDDSVIRGTTAKEIIQMARDSGAKKVYFASAAPVVRYPNVYGIDMPIAEELIAYKKSINDICESIKADWLIYQDLNSLYRAVNNAIIPGKLKITRFEDSMFTGDYISGRITKTYLNELANLRNDTTKTEKRRKSN
ncbi:amidophosphoribosyltransferase [Coxiella endosymbiont of Amblyomma americanum]|uniref:amidophosphoribosyltransferase n=1 Tax=Coxiella endosymbiont of Amblyomma americanum TaxID=325775 RepID=UPI00057FFF02|nr:amidophosphoribosyltransferase [Coxiella endosymbiont of Amblyomma americanum]AJC50569.1 amidophosphoribosyltransferase [Coxiella endosymbiont of Amblyomma americanum]AUJ58902.1 amidophosphoribosyltransferase [Coxiella-like endosymbiont of Amblyomma americanum]